MMCCIVEMQAETTLPSASCFTQDILSQYRKVRYSVTICWVPWADAFVPTHTSLSIHWTLLKHCKKRAGVPMGRGRIRCHTAMLRDHPESVVETEDSGLCNFRGGKSLGARLTCRCFSKPWKCQSHSAINKVKNTTSKVHVQLVHHLWSVKMFNKSIQKQVYIYLMRKFTTNIGL